MLRRGSVRCSWVCSSRSPSWRRRRPTWPGSPAGSRQGEAQRLRQIAEQRLPVEPADVRERRGAPPLPAVAVGEAGLDGADERAGVVGDDLRAGLALELLCVRGDGGEDDGEACGEIRLQLPRI